MAAPLTDPLIAADVGLHTAVTRSIHHLGEKATVSHGEYLDEAPTNLLNYLGLRKAWGRVEASHWRFGTSAARCKLSARGRIL